MNRILNAVGGLSPLVEISLGSEGKSVGGLAEVSDKARNEICFKLGMN